MKNKIGLMKKKDSGQGMVEFALVLPMLLLLYLGIIELGRMMVVYSSVMAASREAARYASAAGFAYGNVPYYLDTAGIEKAARRIAFLTGGDIDITWDEGPNTSTFTPDDPQDVDLGDRVVIVVSAPFNPLFGFTPLQPFAISATTARTILKQVNIYGNPPTTPGFGVLITAPTLATFVEGQSITFSALAQNASGAVTYNWSSDLDGVFGTSVSFSFSTLSVGTHVITLLGTDEDGDTDTDQIQITILGQPQVAISSPSEGSVHQEGVDINFSGSATDEEDGDLSGSLVWTRDGGIPIGTGASFTAQLPVGSHLITASVTDTSGVSASDSVSIVVEPQELPPVVVIDSPVEGANFQENTDISFSGSATDSKDGPISGNLVWKLSDGTVIGNGPAFTYNQLPLGTHTITAEAMDTAGLIGQDTVTITIVSGEPPQVEIISPGDGSSFQSGETITFVAEATDLEDDRDSKDLILNWFVDQSADPNYSGDSFATSTLSEGTHTIRVQVVDSNQNEVWDSILINIAPNTAPTVTIASPTDEASYIEGESVVFNAVATDGEEGDLSASIVWTSNLMPGTIGTGSSFSRPDLVLGSHTITASVTDQGGLGLTGTATLSLDIIPDPCGIQPSPPTKDLTKVTWEFINNGSYSYSLIGFNIPWLDSQSDQALKYVEFGSSGGLLQLWQGEDSTDGSTFGSVGSEFSWIPFDPNFTFEAGPGQSEKILSIFQRDIESVPGIMTAVFINNQTGNSCTCSSSICQLANP